MRNHITRRIAGLVLALTMVIGLMAIPGGAVSNVEATLDPTLNIVIDGQKRTFFNEGGNQVHPVTYKGTTYLPIRAIGAMMGKNVSWNANTRTAELSGTSATAGNRGTLDRNPVRKTVTAQLHDDYTVKVDGVVRTFTDANGNRVYPLLYANTNYLPVRAIGNLMGKTVAWDGATNTAVLSGGSVVPDGSNFAGGQTGSQSGTITVEQAKQKALEHAGLSAAQVTFVDQKLDWENGRQVYEIEFYTNSFMEFDYEIDAATGAIVSFDQDAEFYTRPSTPTPTPSPAPSQGSSSGVISRDRAIQIALGRVSGATAANVVKCQLDRDDGIQVYEIEIRVGRQEYDIEINAVTGAILDFDADD